MLSSEKKIQFTKLVYILWQCRACFFFLYIYILSGWWRRDAADYFFDSGAIKSSFRTKHWSKAERFSDVLS